MFGTYRYILALLVIIVHTWASPFSFFAYAGICAVFGFFMLSGYLMSLVLDKKYIPANNIKGFYKNRSIALNYSRSTKCGIELGKREQWVT